MLEYSHRSSSAGGHACDAGAYSLDPWAGDEDDLRRRLVAAFAAFGPSYLKWLSAEARSHGVTYARMRLLHVLRCRGPQIMSSLREELDITARSVTSLVDALEEDGFAARRSHPTDRRATVVELTDAGADALAGQFESHTRRAAALFGSLSEEDQEQLLRIMGELTAALADFPVRERSEKGA